MSITFDKDDKFRQWELVLYPMSMIDNWQDELPRLFQVPLAYIIHDKDKYKLTKDEKDRLVHVHLWVVWNNTVSVNAMIKLANKLAKDGEKCCSTGQPVFYPQQAFDYLTHKDEKSKKQGKHLYNDDELILCNNFDLGSLIQLSLSEKTDIKTELSHIIRKECICDYMSLFYYVSENYGDNSKFMMVVQTEYNYLDKICSGCYKNWKRSQEIKNS